MIRLFISALLLPLASSGSLEATDKAPANKVVPLANPWDANEWEPGSSVSFWHAKQDQKASPQTGGKEAPVSPSPSKGSGGNPIPSRNEDFPNRQSEK